MVMSGHILALLNKIALLFPAFIFVFTIKGFFQALFAKLMGDRTAYHQGYLTLNPLAHVDVFGITTTMVLIFFLGVLLGEAIPRGTLILLLILFGVRWTFPPPVNESYFKHHTLGSILTIFSGTIGTFTLAFFCLFLVKFLTKMALASNILISLSGLLLATVDLGIWFGIINIIPIPPFSGGRLLRHILPYSKMHILEWLEEYSFYILLALLFLPVVSNVFWGTLYVFHFFVKKTMLKILFL